MRTGILAAVCLVTSAMSVAHAAPQMHIEYAEAVELPTSPGKAQFDAYGRRFALTLESNDRVLNAISAASKARLGRAQVLRGKVDGVPGSWVRLTRVGAGVQGAIWDGNDIYVVADYGSIIGKLTTPLLAAASQTVVYRLSDTLNGLPPEFCGLAEGAAEESGKSGATALTQYKTLVSELRASAATVEDSLDISLIADRAYQDLSGANTADAMLARLNVVDGIFAEQIGVLLVPSEFRLMPADADPFTSTDPETLLEQLATYREATPAVSAAGLAHLITGKNLDGNTLGIAFIDALCDAREGASLSESGQGEFFSALVMAHEIGHNFGARHDGVAGVCAAEPQSYLMSPLLNGSAQFSACSLNSMTAAIVGARGVCIGPSQYVDLALAVPASPYIAQTNGTFSLPMTVRSVGNRVATNVRLRVTFPPYFSMSGATLAGASCSMASSVITCTLVNVAVGEERALDLRVTGNALGTYPVQALLSADNDFITANNTGQVQVGVQSGVDLGVTVATSTATAYVTDAVDYTVDVTSHGTLAAQGGSVSINIGGIPIETFNDGPNTCTIQSANWVLFCQLADIAAGATTRITLRGRPDQARPANGIVSLNVQNDSNPNNNSATMSVAVSAEREIRISASTEELRAVVGTTYDITYTLNALGRHPAENARFSLQHPSMGIIESVLITGFACVADAEFTHCDLGTLSPGSVRTVAVRVRMTGNATSSVTASTRWTHGSGYAFSSVYTRIYANLTVDVAATASNAFPVDEDAVGSAAFSIETKGVDPAQNVTATIELAAPARLESLVVSNGPAGWTCTLLTAQRGRCTGSFNGGPRYDDRRAVLQFTYVSVTAGDHLATAAVNAANDGDPSNNAAQLTLQVRPYVDLGVTGSTAARLLRNGETTTIDATIITGKNPVPNARLNPRASDESLVVESVTIGGVDCPQSGSGSFCELGTLPANSAIAVRAVFRAMVGERSTYATLNVYPDSDANSNNNHLAVQLFTLNPSDLQLQVAQNSVTATNGTSLQFPRINVHNGAATARDITVNIPLPPFVSVTSVTTLYGGICTGTSTLVCTLAAIAPNNTMALDVHLTATGAGTFTSNVTASAFNDSTANNNASAVVVTVNAPSSSSSSGGGSSSSSGGGSSSSGGGGQSSGGGGGGGGGRFEWLALMMLGALVLRRQRRLSPARAPRSARVPPADSAA